MIEPAIPPGRGRPLPRAATPRQRLGLALGLLAAVALLLWMFADILTPFVLAATLAYFLDPVASRMERIGVRRGIGAFVLVLLIVALGLMAALLLYPLVIAQIGVLLTRLPGYIATIGQSLREFLISLEEQAGPEVVDARLRELIIGQAGTMVGWLGTTATRLIGGGVALFSRGFAVPLEGAITLLGWFVAVTTLASLLAYVTAAARRGAP